MDSEIHLFRDCHPCWLIPVTPSVHLMPGHPGHHPCAPRVCGCQRSKDLPLVWTKVAVCIYLGWTLSKREGSLLLAKLDPWDQASIGFQLAGTWSRICSGPVWLWPCPAVWPWLTFLLTWEWWCLYYFPHRDIARWNECSENDCDCTVKGVGLPKTGWEFSSPVSLGVHSG